MSQANFLKQQRERVRRERAAAKLAKRSAREAEVPADRAAPAPDQAGVLAALAALHERFEAGSISFDDFEDAKRQLMDQLDVG